MIHGVCNYNISTYHSTTDNGYGILLTFSSRLAGNQHSRPQETGKTPKKKNQDRDRCCCVIVGTASSLLCGVQLIVDPTGV